VVFARVRPVAGQGRRAGACGTAPRGCFRPGPAGRGTGGALAAAVLVLVPLLPPFLAGALGYRPGGAALGGGFERRLAGPPVVHHGAGPLLGVGHGMYVGPQRHGRVRVP
jgi:hypothetical protein